MSVAAAETDPDRTVQVLEFSLDAERYCVDISDIDEIVEKGSLTPVPNTADHVVGVMDLRGETTTIVNPKGVLDVAGEPTGERVVIFEDEVTGSIGWLVDAVHEVSTIGTDTVESVGNEGLLNGVVSQAERFVIWLDPDAVNASTSTPEAV